LIVAVDSTVLLHLINPSLPVRPDASGKVPDKCRERLDHLIDQLSKQAGRMIVPTPVLAEVLVRAGAAGPDWLTALKGRKAIRVADFDELAAVECAALARERAQRTRRPARDKAKFDEQIVAIAAVQNVGMILSDDDDIRGLAPKGMQVKGIGDLELPPQDAQAGLFDNRPEPDLPDGAASE
jgi:hypothetical protein